jgi:hypothetical protein
MVLVEEVYPIGESFYPRLTPAYSRVTTTEHPDETDGVRMGWI